ncbi:MAG: nitroreductase family deazaflavin-dependent oxidoreductase [Acidimicrobiia bacterium]|nr:nitroreductase family deazaflavin-dependent oxidoreductase [Acidimicrobiia bacterium]
MSILDHRPRRWLSGLFRAPERLYERGWGWLFGNRLLLLRHVGRSSGLLRRTMLEVVLEEADPPVWYVVAGWGERADWLQNLVARPEARIVIGRQEVAVTADVLPADLGARVFAGYRRDHRLAARLLGRFIGIDLAGDLVGLATRMPVVALRGTDPSYPAGESPSIAPVLTTRAETRATYDRIARYYEPLEGYWERPARRQGIAALGPLPGERILEIGSGPGSALAELARDVHPGGQVVGLDLSSAMCRAARRRLEAIDALGPAAVTQGDAAALPFATNAFDACFMSFTLELFDTPLIPVVLAEVHRVVRPGGRVAVVALSGVGPDTWMRRAYGWGHVKLPRLLDCRPIHTEASLGEAGFAVVTSARRKLWGLPIDVVVAARAS